MTMTRPLILMICCIWLLGDKSFSQASSYTPFPQGYARWIINRDGPHGPGANGRWNLTQYETGSDTVINGFTYKNVKVSEELKDIYPGPKNIWTYNYGPKKLAFAYRNDIPGKRVYILTDTNRLINGNLKKEFLWYDFNSEIGDTLKSTYAINWRQGFVDYKRITVSNNDSLFLCGEYRKRYKFKCEGGGFNDRLIEGAGFESNFIETHTYCLFEPLFIYTTDFSCSPTSVEDEYTSQNTVSFYPNPADEHLQILWNQQSQQEQFNIAISDCSGRTVLQNTSDKGWIDVSMLKKGIYIIFLTDKQGRVYKDKFIKQ